MERKTDLQEKGAGDLRREWQKPSVEELDINAMTLAGTTGDGSDNQSYS
ncbi:paeninodin family lasso peptide [Desulfatiglans anilini]|nr:paeninodin family lasso peptide [Desulfatiglans anilini]